MSTYVMTFASTTAAMGAAKAFKTAAVPHTVIPVPTAISAGCGMALRFVADDAAALLDSLPEQAHPTNQATLYREVSKASYEKVRSY